MSGVLHPEGPEPVRTYWLRRVLLLLALVILVMVSIGLARASSGATRTAAPPPDAAPLASPSAVAAPSSATSASPSPTPSSSSSTSSSDSSSARTSAPKESATAACERDQLQASLTGKQRLKIAQPASFTVTLRNAGDEACVLNLAKIDFELKVSAGKKLIWSSRACSTSTFVVAAKLELDQAMSWVMGWDGRGLAAGCTQAGPAPKSGTYVVTAQLTGGKVTQLPVTLRA